MAPNSVRSLDVVHKENFGTATRNASSIAELIATIPQSWRPALGESLTGLYRIATKLCNVQTTLAQYERHAADGSFPASIRNSIKDPKIQFCKEFLGTEDGALARGLIEADLHNARKSFLACAVKRKKEELATLQTLAQWNIKGWRKVVADVAHRIASTTGATISGTIDNDTPPKWSTGTQTDLVNDCKGLWLYGDTYHYRTIAIARSIADRNLVDKAKTLSLKKNTDVEMRDADTELSTREVVRDEMQTQIRLLKTELTRSFGQSKKPAKNNKPKQKGGPNPSRVKKGNPQSKRKGSNKKRV